MTPPHTLLSHISLITLLTFHIPWVVKLSRIHFFLLPRILKQRHDVTCSQMAADSCVIPSPKRKHIQPSVNSQVCGGSPVRVCFIFPYVFYQFPSLLLSFITVVYSPSFPSFPLRRFSPNSLFYLSHMSLLSTSLLHDVDTFSTSYFSSSSLPHLDQYFHLLSFSCRHGESWTAFVEIFQAEYWKLVDMSTSIALQ